jgi:hypothetical protein
MATDDKRCGTCKYFLVFNDKEQPSFCVWAAYQPFEEWQRRSAVFTCQESDGTDCPVWAAKDVNNGN